ncbi:MAG: ATP-binding cassette domain-containing protein [Clostridia bacterium]|nr:ATP-binding cassette domain-containing protein [Clostridia bacterium]
MLELTGIEKVFSAGTENEQVLFRDFSLTVKKGDFVSVIGSNGSGKTTLFNLISGSDTPDKGQIFLEGKDITHLSEYRRGERIGRVYQNPALGTVPGLSVLENLLLADNKGKVFGLTPLRNKEKQERLAALAESLGLGLEEKLNVPVGLLSGGQRQALSLLTSAMRPLDLLLLDEHTAALDPKTADRVMDLTLRIVKEKKVTTVMVTHNLKYAAAYGDRLLMMHGGKVILDVEGEEKNKCDVDSLLNRFYQISVEAGNAV